MTPLNLPPFEYDFKTENGQQFIFDFIRKKYIVNTPEEWVRQHFVNFLINHRNYSKALIKLETGLNYGKRRKRTDIQIYSNTGEIYILAECKAPNIPINQNVINQILQYHKVLDAKILAITNGIDHVFIAKNTDGSIEYLQDLPIQEA
jgi:hypothetical protein